MTLSENNTPIFSDSDHSSNSESVSDRDQRRVLFGAYGGEMTMKNYGGHGGSAISEGSHVSYPLSHQGSEERSFFSKIEPTKTNVPQWFTHNSTTDSLSVQQRSTSPECPFMEPPRQLRTCRLHNNYTPLHLKKIEGMSSSTDDSQEEDEEDDDDLNDLLSNSTSDSDTSSDSSRKKRVRRERSLGKKQTRFNKKKTVKEQSQNKFFKHHHDMPFPETSYLTPLIKTRQRQNALKYCSASTQSPTSSPMSYHASKRQRESYSSTKTHRRLCNKTNDPSSSPIEEVSEYQGWYKRRDEPDTTDTILSVGKHRSQRSAISQRHRNSRYGAKEKKYNSDSDSDFNDYDSEDDSFYLDKETNPSTPEYIPTVERALGYRFLGDPEDSELLCVPNSRWDETPYPTLHTLEFFIKWVHHSHLHNSWCSFDYLVEHEIKGQKRVENFFRKLKSLHEQSKELTVDDIEQQNISLELQRQMDFDYLVAERIVAYRVVDYIDPFDDHGVPHGYVPLVPPASWSMKNFNIRPLNAASSCYTTETCSEHLPELCNETKQEPQDEEKNITVATNMYLVKWTNTQYDQCTWETLELLQKNGFQRLVDRFHERQSKISGPESAHHPLNFHPLSQTSFEPYEKTPFFLDQGTHKELRDYQLTGVNWMLSHMKKGFSVLLADEMGLGKTVQTISVIGHLMYSELLVGPYLIVVPQSTADNWLSEFELWLPSANVIVYHGNPASRELIRHYEMAQVSVFPYVGPSLSHSKERLGSGIKTTTGGRMRKRWSFDVCICTFSILNNPDELNFLKSIHWYFMAVDEAHLLKNRKSRRFRELNDFQAEYRVLLSGTPLHNNLEELWSLLHFLCPRLYENFDTFQERFCEIERPDSMGALKEHQLATLQSELNQLVLRRVKKDVEKSLPRKVERILRVELSPQQSHYCKAILAKNYQALAQTTGTSKTSLQNICMDLKKACNHPLLLRSDFDIMDLQSQASLSAAHREKWYRTLLNTSGKLALLDKLLPYLKERQHRVLIFSQMVRMLNILSMYLILRGYKHQRLDGTMTREMRKKAIDHFNLDDSDDFCFLLSTRAGGLGLNLTSADTVIIYDSDWNPQNDLQAEARAHRIGQTKAVQIYRLVTKDTIEERILERAKAKMVLDTLVVQGLNKKIEQSTSDATSSHGFLSNKSMEASQKLAFTKEDLTRILKFGASRLWKTDTLVKEEDSSSPTQCNQQFISSSSECNAIQPEINLERVLAEAEENTSESFADQLLSSFTNISDFSYQASYDNDTSAKTDHPEENDALFWEKTIPEEERHRHDPLNNLIHTKRERKRVQRRGVVSLDYLDDPEELQDSVCPKKTRATKPNSSCRAVSRPASHGLPATGNKKQKSRCTVRSKRTMETSPLTPQRKPSRGTAVQATKPSIKTSTTSPASSKKQTNTSQPRRSERHHSLDTSGHKNTAPHHSQDSNKEEASCTPTLRLNVSYSTRATRRPKTIQSKTKSPTPSQAITYKSSKNTLEHTTTDQLLNSNRIPKRRSTNLIKA